LILVSFADRGFGILFEPEKGCATTTETVQIEIIPNMLIERKKDVDLFILRKIISRGLINRAGC
jgi:hypothetical protein